MSSSTLQKKLENVNPKLVRNKIGWAVSLKISHCEGKVSLEKRKCAGKEEQDHRTLFPNKDSNQFPTQMELKEDRA